MTAGLSRLRLPARDFWAMTPRELAAALGLDRTCAAPGRAALERMMTRFPDDAARASDVQARGTGKETP